MKKILFILITCFLSIHYLRAEKVIKKYTENLFLEKNGDLKINIIFRIKCDSSDIIKLPLNYINDVEVINYNPEIKNIYLEKNNGIKFIVFQLNGISDTSKNHYINLKIQNYFDYEKNKSDFGNFIFTYKYINFSSLKFEQFESLIYLPDGYVISSILEILPKPKSNNPEDPYNYGRLNNQNFLKLKNRSLGIGDNIYLKFKFKNEEKSKLLLVFLIVIAIGYLVFFKDLIKNKK